MDVELDNAVAKPTVSIPDQPDQAIYDFRLFSGNTKTSHACDQWINKVRIESPTPVTKEPGFVHPRRSEDYYFTGTRSDVERRRYEEATVNGDQVLKESRGKWVCERYPIDLSHLPHRPLVAFTDCSLYSPALNYLGV